MRLNFERSFSNSDYLKKSMSFELSPPLLVERLRWSDGEGQIINANKSIQLIAAFAFPTTQLPLALSLYIISQSLFSAVDVIGKSAELCETRCCSFISEITNDCDNSAKRREREPEIQSSLNYSQIAMPLHHFAELKLLILIEIDIAMRAVAGL